MSLTEHETTTSDEPMTEPTRLDAATELKEELRLLEALLFAAPSPVDEDGIKQRLPDGVDIPSLIDELTAFYAPRGVNIVRVAGGWTIRTAPDLAPRLKLTQKVGRKLSRAAIETLAIVAYHQPVTRAEIEEIRGVVISKGTLDTLMETGWIVPKGRKQTVGRPVTWVTTEAFLLHFGLANISRPSGYRRAACRRTDRAAAGLDLERDDRRAGRRAPARRPGRERRSRRAGCRGRNHRGRRGRWRGRGIGPRVCGAGPLLP